MDVASLTLGIVSIVFCYIPILPLAMGVVGIVLASMVYKRNRTKLGTAGLITSIIGTSLSFFIDLLYILLLAFVVEVLRH